MRWLSVTFIKPAVLFLLMGVFNQQMKGGVLAYCSHPDDKFPTDLSFDYYFYNDTTRTSLLPTLNSYVKGTVVEYKCKEPDSTLIGNPTRECQTRLLINGYWTGDVPQCKRNACDHPPSSFPKILFSFDSQTISLTRFPVGTRAFYYEFNVICNTNEKKENLIRYCVPGGSWNGSEPHCGPKTTTKMKTTSSTEMTTTSTIKPESNDTARNNEFSVSNTTNWLEPETAPGYGNWMIAGLCVGLLVGLVIAVALVIFCKLWCNCCKKSKKEKPQMTRPALKLPAVPSSVFNDEKETNGSLSYGARITQSNSNRMTCNYYQEPTRRIDRIASIPIPQIPRPSKRGDDEESGYAVPVTWEDKMTSKTPKNYENRMETESIYEEIGL